MSITKIENQPVSFGSDSCGCTNDFCLLVDQTDTTSFQVTLTELTGQEILADGGFDPYLTGTADSYTLNKLNDSTATFSADGVTASNHTAINKTDVTEAIITTVDSDTQLTFGSDLFDTGNEQYEIIRWAVGTNWTYDYITDQMVAAAAGASDTLIQRNLGLLNNTLYKVQINLSAYTSGDLRINLGDTTYDWLEADIVTTDEPAIYIRTATVSANHITLSGTANAFTGTITSISVKQMSEVGFQIKDCDTGTAEYTEADATSVTYIEGIVDPIAQVDLNWTTLALTDGCKCICVFDAALEDNFIVNGTFETEYGSGGDNPPRGWAIENNATNGWVSTGGEAYHTIGGTGANYLRQDLSLDASTCNYTLSWQHKSPSAGNITYKINYLDSNGTRTTIDTRTASDPVYSAASLTLSAADIKTIEFQAEGADADDIAIDTITIAKADGSCYDCLFNSDNICLETSLNCNVLVTATNDDNAYGFDFENHSFTMRLRLTDAKVRFARYQEERLQDRDSTGSYFTQYAERVKVEELQTRPLPEELHDALSAMLQMRTVQISKDGTTANLTDYVKTDGEYSPNWVKNYALAPVIVDVQKKLQDTFNRNT